MHNEPFPHPKHGHIRRVPRTRERIAPLIATLIAAVLILGTLIALPLAQATPSPAGGPRLGGGAAHDGTLFGSFTFEQDGKAFWLNELSVLQTGTIWILVYNPNTKTEAGLMDLTFTWETGTPTTVQESVNGTLVTRVETVWNVTDIRTFQVNAPYRNIDYTEIELPKKDGERLTITYGEGGARSFRLAQLEHTTSPLYAKQARQVLQDKFVDALKVLTMAAAAAAAGIVVSRWVYNKSGRYVPSVGAGFWILGIIIGGAAAVWLWTQNREGVVLNGSLPPLAVLATLVCFFTLQVWRDEPDAFLFLRIHKTMEDNTPRASTWKRYIPQGEDPKPLSEATNHQRYVDDSWGAFFWRFLLDARTYLEYPQTHRWNYEGARGPFRRVHVLDGDKEFETTEKPHFDWFPYGWRLPWWTIHRRGITQVPVSPWAQKEKLVDVLANIVTQQEMATDHQALLVEAGTLRAEIRSGVDKRAQELLDKVLLAIRAVSLGESFEEAKKKHEEIKRTKEAKKKPLPDQGGQGTTEPIPVPTTPTVPAPAPPPAGGA